MRLSIASSIRVAGRKTEVSRPNPGEARTQLLERVLDPLGHLEGVRTRELLDDEQKAVAIVDDRVTDQRLVVDLDVGDVGEAEVAARSLDGHLAKLPSGLAIWSSTFLTWSLCCGVSMNPPVPGVEASR